MIFDFHSHILPAIDDGSKSLQETLQMLSIMAQQGVECIVATPHFYPDRMRIEEFLEKRAKAYEAVLLQKKSNHPALKCGAELAFFGGIGKTERLERFCIEDTNLLLIEMPFRNWTDLDLKAIESVIDKGITPILAHVERYYGYQRDMESFYSILQLPVYIQINAETFTSFKMRKVLNRIIKCNDQVLLGTDCHGAEYRAPNLSAGRAALKRKFGEELLLKIDALGEQLLKTEDPSKP